jgi:hypothetical protein
MIAAAWLAIRKYGSRVHSPAAYAKEWNIIHDPSRFESGPTPTSRILGAGTFDRHDDRDGDITGGDEVVQRPEHADRTFFWKTHAFNNQLEAMREFPTQVVSPPYPAPLRALQITLRTYDPDSKQIRQMKASASYTND